MAKRKKVSKAAAKPVARPPAKPGTSAKPARSRASSHLKEYRAKRNFTRTPEPSGKPAARKPMRSAAPKRSLAFCVQKHLASHLHYDFRLEHNGVLLSWAVPKGPSLNPKNKRLAMKVEDHPFDYGDFEGVIPEGYGAGIVMLWDKGTWTPQTDDVDAALKKGELKFETRGVKLKGSWVLVRIRGVDSRTWLLIKHRDQWAGEIDITKVAAKSIKSFGDFEDILAKEKPDVWLSGRMSSRGGEAGAMMKKIVEQVARMKKNKRAATAKPKLSAATSR
jgi:bifunctional non-homologous end joining protein LigD